jgi:hypothetical protein
LISFQNAAISAPAPVATTATAFGPFDDFFTTEGVTDSTIAAERFRLIARVISFRVFRTGDTVNRQTSVTALKFQNGRFSPVTENIVKNAVIVSERVKVTDQLCD